MQKRVISISSVFFFITSGIANAVDIPQDDQDSQSFNMEQCVDNYTQQCIDDQCSTSEETDCQDQCATLATGKCQQQADE